MYCEITAGKPLRCQSCHEADDVKYIFVSNPWNPERDAHIYFCRKCRLELAYRILDSDVMTEEDADA